MRVVSPPPRDVEVTVVFNAAELKTVEAALFRYEPAATDANNRAFALWDEFDNLLRDHALTCEREATK